MAALPVTTELLGSSWEWIQYIDPYNFVFYVLYQLDFNMLGIFTCFVDY